MLGLLVAGLVVFVVGLLGIGFGIPVKEFSFGNTLIVTGVLGACTGALLVAIGFVLRELKTISSILASAGAREAVLDPFAAKVTGTRSPAETMPRPPESRGPGPEAPPPWQNEFSTRDRAPAEDEEVSEPLPPPAPEPAKKRRNLLFMSTRRERAAAETGGGTEAASDEAFAAGADPQESFEDAWPSAADRSRPPRRAARASEADEVRAAPPPIRRPSETAAVTILKSGVVDGMAYSLYSDGSIEAQMPEGMLRFGSIDDLRKHLDQRG